MTKTDPSQRFDVAFPFGVDARGRLDAADYDPHVEQMMEQLLFTNPGERVNRPEFGVGLLRRIFAQETDPLIASLQVDIIAALRQWLPDVVHVDAVRVEIVDTTVNVDITYVVLQTGQRTTARFSR